MQPFSSGFEGACLINIWTLCHQEAIRGCWSCHFLSSFKNHSLGGSSLHRPVTWTLCTVKLSFNLLAKYYSLYFLRWYFRFCHGNGKASTKLLTIILTKLFLHEVYAKKIYVIFHYSLFYLYIMLSCYFILAFYTDSF